MTEHPSHNLGYDDEDNLSLVNIVSFFRLNSKLIGLTTIILSVIAIPLALLKPEHYQKQLSVSVKPSTSQQSFIAAPLAPSPVLSSIDYAGTLAVEFLQNVKLAEITIKPKYNAQTQKLNLTLQSASSTALSSPGLNIVNLLETKFQEPVGETLQASLSANKLKIERTQQILSQLEQQIKQLPIANTAQVEALEAQRAEQITYKMYLEFDKADLEQSQKNIAEFTQSAISIKVLTESDVQSMRSSQQLVVVAVMASFTLSVLIAISYNLLRHLKDKRFDKTGSADV